jgi:hypothetical protein
MDLSKYTLGFGADVSKKQSEDLLGNQTKNVKHVFMEPNNFYSFKDHFNYESLDFIYSENLINTNKFYRVLLKEWFNLCKIGGHIIVKFTENKILGLDKLKRELTILFNNKIQIEEIFEGNQGETFISIKKIVETLGKEDNISKWSFGILTMGDQDGRVDQEIASILNQNIPEVEIIVCGKYGGEYLANKKITKLAFEDDKNPGWVTGKKNFICKNAKYENIVITHDKFLFDKEWYKGMKKYGNYFEVLSCIIETPEGERAGDWLTYGGPWDKIAKIGLLDYQDWDKNGYLDGGFYILKKSIWEKTKWDENVFWGQAEDIILSKNWEEAGVVPRINPYSKIINQQWNHGRLREYKFHDTKLGKLKSGKISLGWYLAKQIIKTKVLGKNKLHH